MVRAVEVRFLQSYIAGGTGTGTGTQDSADYPVNGS